MSRELLILHYNPCLSQLYEQELFVCASVIIGSSVDRERFGKSPAG